MKPLFDARSAWILTTLDARRPQTSHVAAVGSPDQMLVDYHAHYSAHDEWVNAAMRCSEFGAGAVLRGGDLVAPDELKRTCFSRHFLARHGVTDVLGAVVEAGTGGEPALFVASLRSRDQPPRTAANARLLRTLAPHMRQVLRLAVGATLHEIVQRIDLPLVHLGADGRIVDRSPAAASTFADTLPWLRERAGRPCLGGAPGWQEVAPALQALATGHRRSGQ